MNTKSEKPTIIECVLKALKESLNDTENIELKESMQFQNVPSFDSMSSVSFQMELSKEIGEKAFEVSPMMEMTLQQYADLLS